MHIVRAISAAIVAIVGALHLDDVMSADDQKKTGVSTLNVDQKKALETWVDQQCASNTEQSKPLTIAENLNSGTQLRLSDGSLYEIAPEDRDLASVWITPFEVKVIPSGDPNYPYKIVNTVTNSSVKAKPVVAPKS